jgi:pimeloyl-ACP methyl ester carboxylesterase
MAEKLIPNGQGEIIENAGHFLSVDQPEVVNQKILDFLASIKN